ncbi:MAG: hypothetical protein QNJ98_05060 [Planctomycetota bacterium]|nr:hypothetical protein [Planctomycetota bacterium]
MSVPERRRAERLPVDWLGRLFLSEGREIEVRIKNIGRMGALVQIADLEDAVFEGERAVLDHPILDDYNQPLEGRARTNGRVVRVELEFLDEGVARQLAVHFDDGTPPAGYEAT